MIMMREDPRVAKFREALKLGLDSDEPDVIACELCPATLTFHTDNPQAELQAAGWYNVQIILDDEIHTFLVCPQCSSKIENGALPESLSSDESPPETSAAE